MENVTWWNEKLWKSFIDHPNPVITKTNDTKPTLTGTRYTSQRLSLNRNEQLNNNSQTTTLTDSAYLTPSQLNPNKNILQNTINFESKSIGGLQETSVMKQCNPPQLYCNNLFHQICSRPVMNNLQSIYGNKNRPLGSLRIYYLTRPHSAVTLSRPTSLQRSTSQESSSIDRTLSSINMVSPQSARRSSNTSLNLSRECSFASLLQSTNISGVKQSNSIDCSGKICPLHERSATPLVYEGVNKKSTNNNNSNLSTRRRSAPKARTTTLSETSQQQQFPKPPRRASSACVDDKSYRYTNKFTNDFKVSSGQQEYNRAYKTYGSNLEYTANDNEFIMLNSIRKFSYPTSIQQHAPSAQDNDIRKKVPVTNSNQSSSLSVIPLSFQNVKYFKYPTSQRRSSKTAPVVTPNKHQQNNISSVQLESDRIASLYKYDKNVIKQTVEATPPENQVYTASNRSVKNATLVQSKTDTILKVEDKCVKQLNNSKKSCPSEMTEKCPELKDNTSEIVVTTDKINYDVSNQNNNKKEEEEIAKNSLESEAQPLLSEQQIQVIVKDTDQSTPSHINISYGSQSDEWRMTEENVTQSKDAENEDSTSTETTQLQPFSCEDEVLCLDSLDNQLKSSVTQSNEDHTLDELNTPMSEKTDQNNVTKLCDENENLEELSPVADNEQFSDYSSNNTVENTSIHNQPYKCLSTSNNLELQSLSSTGSGPSFLQQNLSYIGDKWSYCTTSTSTTTMSATQPIKSILKRSKSLIKPYTNVTLSSSGKITNISLTSDVSNDNVSNELITKRPSSANNYLWKSELSTNNPSSSNNNSNGGGLRISTGNQMANTTANNNRGWIRPKSSVQKNKFPPEELHSTDRLNLNRSNNNSTSGNKPGVRFDIKNNAIFEFYPYDIIYKS